MSSNRQNYHKKYYETNKEKFQEYEKQKYHCDICDKDVRKYYKKQHDQTPKHLKNVAKENGLSGGSKTIIKKALIGSVEKMLKRIEKLQNEIELLNE